MKEVLFGIFIYFILRLDIDKTNRVILGDGIMAVPVDDIHMGDRNRVTNITNVDLNMNGIFDYCKIDLNGHYVSIRLNVTRKRDINGIKEASVNCDTDGDSAHDN